MAKSGYETIRQDTASRIGAISPTVASSVRWRFVDRNVGEKVQPGADRVFLIERWLPVSGAMVFGADQQQIARDMIVQTSYVRGKEFHDRIAADEVDLEEALAPSSTYCSWTGGALRVRRVVRESIEMEEGEKEGVYIVRFPVRVVWRETVTLA